MKNTQLHPVSSFSSVIGVLLTLERKKLGFNQNEMAEALSTTISSWSRLERGITPITIEQLIAASKKLGIKASLLIEQAEYFEEVAKESGWSILTTKEIESIQKASLIVPGIGAALAGASIAISNSQLTKQVQAVLLNFKEKQLEV